MMSNANIIINSSQICICVYWHGDKMIDSACAEANIFDDIDSKKD